MDKKRSNRMWCLMAVLLYIPFFLEFFAYLLFMKIEPEWLGGALFWILYTYVFYGAAIIVYHKWRKKNGEPVEWKLKSPRWITILLVLLVGIIFRRLQLLMLGHTQMPMIISEFFGYTKNMPTLWMGIAGFLLQEVYYLFEFTLVACIIDCAQRACEQLGWSERIPWGGLFLGLTWGLGHIITKGDIAVGVSSLLLSLVVGSMYTYVRRSPTCAWITVAAAYLL